MRKISSYIVCFLAILFVQSQGRNALDLIKGDRAIGNEYYNQMDYRNAINFYEKALDKHPDDAEVKFKIAQSYLKLNETLNSEIWLRSLASDPEATKEVVFLYAEVLMINGKLDQAKTWYENTLKQSWDAEVASKLSFIGKIDSYRNSARYRVTNHNINSELADFALYPLPDKNIFLSSRQAKQFIQYQPANASREDEGMIRFFVQEDNSDISPLLYSDEVKPYYHDGPFSFFNDGKMVAFTRNDLTTRNKDHGFVNLKIFFADCSTLNEWKEITPFQHNNKSYSVGHPSVSNDGKIMVFSSDMPGGEGKADLYISYKEGNSWTKPVNLGPEVNTAGAELFPYLFNDSTLFFSSSGLGGFGGLDIFQAKLKDFSAKEPDNMGEPLNSSSDDFSFFLNKDSRGGYLSSNRTGGKGSDDIYTFQSTIMPLVVKLIDQSNDQPLDNIDIEITAKSQNYKRSALSNESGHLQFDLPIDEEFYLKTISKRYYSNDSIRYASTKTSFQTDTLVISLKKHQLVAKGLVVSQKTGQPITSASVKLTASNQDLDTFATDEKGIYSFEIDPNRNYLISISGKGYIPFEYAVNTNDRYSGEIYNEVTLEDSIKAPTLYDLFVMGRLYSNETHELIPNAQVVLENTSTGIKDSMTTTENGEYSFRLAPNEKYKVIALGTGFVPNGYSISTIDLYEGELLNDILLEEEYEDKLIVFFDFNARELNDSYEESLQNMLKILSENPKSTLKITAHADTRGSADYNKQLSIDRLNSVKRYFMKNGISENRLEGVSFGEELPLNQCSSGVDCPEEDHSKNRRAELKVQMNGN